MTDRTKQPAPGWHESGGIKSGPVGGEQTFTKLYMPDEMSWGGYTLADTWRIYDKQSAPAVDQRTAEIVELVNEAADNWEAEGRTATANAVRALLPAIQVKWGKR